MNKFLKYLLCILFSILSINFIISITSFFQNTDTYLASARINANPTNEETVEAGKQIEKKLNSTINDLKEQNGENYPALGILYYKAISHYSSVGPVQNLIFSVIAGIALGHIIYFIFISGLKSYKLASVLIIGLALTALLLALSDVYTSIANSKTVKFGFSEFLWNMEVSGIAYAIVCIILVFVNKIYKTYYEIRYS